MASGIDQKPGHIQIGNVSLELPTLRQSSHPSQRAPEWMVEIPDITKGNVADFETYCELFNWHAEYSRHTLGHTGNELFTTAAIEHTEVYILIPAGTYTAKVRQTLTTGKNIPTITLKRLGNMTDLKKPLQTLTYSSCLLTRAAQKDDYFAISFRFVKIKEENFEIKQDAGDDSDTQAGQNVCEVDYSLNTVA